jgi:hypothetical protein
MPAEDLAACIEELRGRLDRGELAGLGPIQLYKWHEVPDVERRVRLALGWVEYFRTLSPEERDHLMTARLCRLRASGVMRGPTQPCLPICGEAPGSARRRRAAQ